MAGKVNSRKSKAKLDDAIALNGEAKENSESNDLLSQMTVDETEVVKTESNNCTDEDIPNDDSIKNSKGTKRKASESLDESLDTSIAELPNQNDKEAEHVEGDNQNDASIDTQTRRSGRKVRPKKPKTAYDDSPDQKSSQDKVKEEPVKEEPEDVIQDVPDTSLVKIEKDMDRRPSSQMSAKSEEGQSTDTPITTKSKLKSDLSSPLLRVPLDMGWKRELVFRATVDSKNRRQGDIYYYTPAGKKLRSTREIADYLTDGLTVDNFSFAKEPIGLNDPSKEIIRDARNMKGRSSISRPDSPSTNLASSTNTTPLGKRTPKPKLPKGASPPPASGQSATTTAVATDAIIKSSPKKSPKSAFKVKLTNARLSNPGSKTLGVKLSKSLKRKSMPASTEKAKKESIEKTEKAKKVAPTTGKKSSLRNNSSLDENSTKKRVPHETAPSADTTKGDSKEIKDDKQKKTVSTIDKTTTLTHAPFVQHFCLNVSAGYFALLKIFQYLKVQELLRASRVCRLWYEMSNSPSLWRTVRMKNSQVGDWHGFAKSLQKHQTKILDLRKMLIPSTINPDDMWKQFSDNIGLADSLISIDFCRCPAGIIEKLCETNPNMEVINAVTIRDDKLDLAPFATLKNLRELRLKSSGGFEIQKDLSPLKELKNLRHLSITSVKELGKHGCDVIADLTELQSLELGECNDFPEDFGSNVLNKLQKLERLRLEKGQGNCHTFSILECVSKLPLITQLELVNFDIKAGFDKSLALCKNIRRMLIIPTYITQSATTNHMVLSGVIKLSSSLTHFVWGVTLELLRVTELFVDQYENSKIKDKKPLAESIPVLKPVPSLLQQTEEKMEEATNAAEAPQVEILTLQALQKLLNGSLPQTRVRILKIPFHASWRQSISDTQ